MGFYTVGRQPVRWEKVNTIGMLKRMISSIVGCCNNNLLIRIKTAEGDCPRLFAN